MLLLPPNFTACASLHVLDWLCSLYKFLHIVCRHSRVCRHAWL
jgi:hypothetical protein